MPIRTRRWNDPAEPGDGFRLLVCRYRPRALPKADETWDEWWKELAPSADLVADFYGKRGPAIAWPEYRRRYLAEMKAQGSHIAALAERSRGDTVTLLCSSACVDPEHCHRFLLRALIEKARERHGASTRPSRRRPDRS